MTVLRFTLSVLLGLSAWSAAGAAPPPVQYQGMCDASAAEAIGDDHFIVASDEDNLLRLYRRGAGGPPLRQFDLTAFLQPDAKKPSEADIEGAARIGERIYWITSHGANAKGRPRPDRHRLFATAASDTGGVLAVTPVGLPYRGLIDALARDPALGKYHLAQAALKPPEAAGGLNIEGLAATPAGALLVGFRNPLHQGRALLVPLENPDAIIHGGAPKTGAAIELDLGGRGIRSIEYVPALAAYLIVAGPPDDDGAFNLYKWVPGRTPEMLPLAFTDGQHPEALAVYASGAAPLQILSDDGGRRIDGVDCKKIKDPAQQRFRSIAIPLPG